MKKLILVALGAMFMLGGLANATEMMKKDDMGKDEMMKKEQMMKDDMGKKPMIKKDEMKKDDMGMKKDEMKKGM